MPTDTLNGRGRHGAEPLIDSRLAAQSAVLARAATGLFLSLEIDKWIRTGPGQASTTASPHERHCQPSGRSGIDHPRSLPSKAARPTAELPKRSRTVSSAWSSAAA